MYVVAGGEVGASAAGGAPARAVPADGLAACVGGAVRSGVDARELTPATIGSWNSMTTPCGAAAAIAPGLKDETPVAAISDTEAPSRRATPWNGPASRSRAAGTPRRVAQLSTTSDQHSKIQLIQPTSAMSCSRRWPALFSHVSREPSRPNS